MITRRASVARSLLLCAEALDERGDFLKAGPDFRICLGDLFGWRPFLDRVLEICHCDTEYL